MGLKTGGPVSVHTLHIIPSHSQKRIGSWGSDDNWWQLVHQTHERRNSLKPTLLKYVDLFQNGLYHLEMTIKIIPMLVVCASIPFKTNYCLVYDWPISTCFANINSILIGELATWTRFSETGITPLNSESSYKMFMSFS